MGGTPEQHPERRDVSIDALRALAVLFMVLVHAAATWMPSTIEKTTPLAYIVAGIGGLAAPLFVLLFGWGIAASSTHTTQKILYRSAILCVCQIAVNVSAPHLFKPFTPGVLTLFALLYLTSPLWKELPKYPKLETTLIFTFLFLPLLTYSEMGPSDWSERIETTSLLEFISHLLLTGQYPLFPWLMFALIGAHLYHCPKPDPMTLALAITGLCISIFSLVIAVVEQRPWALATDPSGQALLTFFPASTTFLFAATLGTLVIWFVCYQRWTPLTLVPLGHMSLTIYVIHFIPIGIFHQALDHNFSALIHYIVIILYTLVWIFIARLWHAQTPQWTIETIFRKR